MPILDIKGVMKSPLIWVIIFIITIFGVFKPEFISDFEPYTKYFIYFIIFLAVIKYVKVKKIWFRPHELERTYNLDEIKKLKQQCIKVIVVLGVSNVGKTTLINSIFNGSSAKNRTQHIIGRVAKLKNNQYVIFVDVSGEVIPQAYQTLPIANFIIIMLDHSDKHNSRAIQKKRVSENNNYVKSLCTFIQGQNGSDDISIKRLPSLFLTNKSDLWEKKTPNLNDEYKESIKEWKNITKGKVTDMSYTNKFMEKSIEQENFTKNINNILNIIIGDINEK
ncbi:GTPase domain-containing protein [Xenorhabdus bovienii]|uniref:GTPase domain-containing protein n=1 Tax=Xenorhabdus bovienii TaxID=40576 RepID=UPI0023B2636F|nr:GTPase domain-containing protein [Xenorhabdus bovienii]MDE9487228.1 GTPase domain-containing protein [Xenorhabdus bovienii]